MITSVILQVEKKLKVRGMAYFDSAINVNCAIAISPELQSMAELIC